MARFRAEFAGAVGMGQFGEARRLHRSALARGLIPLGEERAALDELVRLAADDPTVSADELHALADEHGLATALAPGPAVEALHERLDAEAWWAEQSKLARRIPLMRPFPARAARLLTGRWAAWRLAPGDVPMMKEGLVVYRRHGQRLGQRFDAARADRLERRIRWHTDPGLLRRILAWWPLAFILCYALWVMLFGR